MTVSKVDILKPLDVFQEITFASKHSMGRVQQGRMTKAPTLRKGLKNNNYFKRGHCPKKLRNEIIIWTCIYIKFCIIWPNFNLSDLSELWLLGRGTLFYRDLEFVELSNNPTNSISCKSFVWIFRVHSWKDPTTNILHSSLRIYSKYIRLELIRELLNHRNRWVRDRTCVFVDAK